MKKILAILLAISVILSLSACGGGSTSTTGTTTSQEATVAASTQAASSEASSSQASTDTTSVKAGPITVWRAANGDAEQAYIDENFKKMYPNVEVNWVPYPSEDLKTQTRLAIQSGSAPDMYQSNAGSIFDDFYKVGSFMDITPLVESMNLMSRINPDYIKPYTKDGKYFGFPTAALTTWQTLYVNRDLFKKAGVTEDPKTVSDLIAASKKFKSAGIAPIALGDKDGWPAILLMGDFYAQQVTDTSNTDNVKSGKDKFTTNKTIQNAFDAVTKLGQAGVYMSGFASQDHTAAVQTFAAGKAAMLYNGSWWTSITGGTNLGFDLDVIPLPFADGVTEDKAVQMSSDMCYVINPKATDLEACKAVLDFLTCEPTAIFNANNISAFSIYPGSNSKVNLDPVFKNDAIISQFDKPSLSPFFDWVFPTPVTEKLKVLLQQGVAGQITTDKAMEQLQAVMDQNLVK